MFLRWIEIFGIFIFSRIVLLGIISKGVNAETNAVKTTVDNPVTGKTYWLYEKVSNLTMARITCEMNGQELIQMPTQNEQLWVNRNLGVVGAFWVGAIEIGKRVFWKVPNGMILNDKKRYFIASMREGDFPYAHEDHLHWADSHNLKLIICQKDYSQKKGNFEMLNGKFHFKQKINEFVGGKFQCASKCMMSVECNVFLLDFLKGYCRIYSGLTGYNSQEDVIDCNSSSISCFARL